LGSKGNPMVSKTGKHNDTGKGKVVSSVGDTEMFKLPPYCLQEVQLDLL